MESNSDADNMVYIDDEEIPASTEQPEVYVETSDGSIVKSGSESNSAETVVRFDEYVCRLMDPSISTLYFDYSFPKDDSSQVNGKYDNVSFIMFTRSVTQTC